jgi:formate hydrogenlyase subunit 3/multisubunit Na+/H+ antiporter MnhD subunit
MDIGLNFLIHSSLTIAAMAIIIVAADIRKARTIALFALLIMFLLEVIPAVLGLQEIMGLAATRMRSFIILGNLLACFYTPAFMSSRLTFSLILVMNGLTLALLEIGDIRLLCVVVAVFFFILIVASGTKNGMHRILSVFGVLCTALISMSVLYPGQMGLDAGILELVGLIFFIGLFPVSPWFSKLYENLPSGLLASAFILQVMFIISLQQQQSLDRNAVLVVLPLLSIVSVLMALAQCNARRALSGLAASQLGFLVYAGSGQHFSDLAASLLAQAQIVAIPGLILTIGILETRIGRLNLSRPSGQYDSYPKLASAMLLFGLMSAGFPLSLIYVAEDLILEAGLFEAPLQGFAWLGVTALTAIAVMKLYLYLCHGGKGFEPGIDILPSKLFAAVFVTGFLIVSSFTLTA